MKKINIESWEVKSQSDAILWHLKKYGSITSYEAIKEYGATRLAAIICNHRKSGYNIDSIPLTKKTRFGRNTTIAKYLYKAPPFKMEQLKLYCEINK
jgi:hypothetical protein